MEASSVYLILAGWVLNSFDPAPIIRAGEYIEFTEVYEGRNAAGVISLLVVVIKNKQMEYIEQNGTVSNKIEGLSSNRFGNRTN